MGTGNRYGNDMPMNNVCDHRNCYGRPCKSLTPEELTPSTEDAALGSQLVAEGWLSTSNKYHRIARLLPGFEAVDLIKAEMIDTPAGQALAELWERDRRFRVRSDEPFVEHRALTLRQYIAFRAAGGHSA